MDHTKILTVEFIEQVVREEMAWVSEEAEEEEIRLAASLIKAYYSS